MDCSIVCFNGCTSPSMRKDALTGATSTSTARTSAPTVRPPEPEKKAKGEPADHALGRSRGGFGTKLHLVTDGNGVPLGALVTAGQTHESKSFAPLMETVRIGRRRRTTRFGRGRQGLQLSSRAHVAGRAGHQGGDSHTPRSAGVEARPRTVSASQRRRAVHRLAQVLPPHRNSLRETRDTLSRDGQARNDPTLIPTARSIKQDLIQQKLLVGVGSARNFRCTNQARCHEASAANAAHHA